MSIATASAGTKIRPDPARSAARIPALIVTVPPLTAVTVVPAAMPVPWTSMPAATPAVLAQVSWVAPVAAPAVVTWATRDCA